MNPVQFSTIVEMFRMEGQIAAGDMAHPDGSPHEKNLDHVQFVFSVLNILREKTHGNLADDEHQRLSNAIEQLREYISQANESIYSPTHGTRS